MKMFLRDSVFRVLLLLFFVVTVLGLENGKDVCGRFLHKRLAGVITSPLFPDHDYPNNVTCYWRIRAHKKRVISITINSLNTEEPYDFLEVKQGRWYTLSPFVERYTGKPDLPIQLTLNSNNAWIRFTSDRYVSAPGFSLTYRAHQIRCPRLPSPPNGLKLEQNRTVGGYVLFGCRQGFRIEGEPKIKCLAMGKWNNKSPSCLECGSEFKSDGKECATIDPSHRRQYTILETEA